MYKSFNLTSVVGPLCDMFWPGAAVPHCCVLQRARRESLKTRGKNYGLVVSKIKTIQKCHIDANISTAYILIYLVFGTLSVNSCSCMTADKDQVNGTLLKLAVENIPMRHDVTEQFQEEAWSWKSVCQHFD